MDLNGKIAEGRRVVDVEAEALRAVSDAIDGTFAAILDAITSCEGKLVITGMGKPGHIARKLAATFSSLGTPSFCLHPAEAMHGDLGMVGADDVVIAISYSGESDEIVRILPNIKMIGATLIAITGNESSTLAQAADILQVLPDFDEADYLGLAPTSSTTAVLAYGDALAVTAAREYGFTESDFGKFHPAGSLGKKLILRVSDLMAKGDDVPTVPEGSTLAATIEELSRKKQGIVSVVDGQGRILGVITDGDLRRAVERRIDIYETYATEIMTTSPRYTAPDIFAIDALRKIRDEDVNSMPVVEGGVVVGTITWQAIVKAGIVA